LCRESFSAHILDVIRGVQDVTYERDYSLLTSYHGDSVANEAVHIRRSLEKRVDGMIVMPALDADGRTNISEFQALQQQGIPVVQVLMRTLPGVPSVMADRYESGRLACRHLIELGHRRIVHLAYEGIFDTRIKGYYEDAIERANGYRDEMISAGLEPVMVTHPQPKHLADYVSLGEQAVPQIAKHPSRPTAIMTFNGYQAFGLIRGLKLMGLAVPEDISIIGFSVLDMETTIFSDPPLTTFVEPSSKIGQEAARMVFDMLEGRPGRDIVLDQRLVIHHSTAPPRG